MEKLPAPTLAMGYTEAEIAQWHADQAALAADPRTAGDRNRPQRLVNRVLKGK